MGTGCNGDDPRRTVSDSKERAASVPQKRSLNILALSSFCCNWRDLSGDTSVVDAVASKTGGLVTFEKRLPGVNFFCGGGVVG